MDIIRRQDAIDAIEAIEQVTWYHQNKNLEMVDGANDEEHQAWYMSQDVYNAIDNVPSVDEISSVAQDIAQIIINEMDMRRWLSESIKAERKKGKWIDRGYLKIGFKCSECDGYVLSGQENYCPWCGADMRGEKDG